MSLITAFLVSGGNGTMVVGVEICIVFLLIIMGFDPAFWIALTRDTAT